MSKIPITLRDIFWEDPFFSSNWGDFGRLRRQLSRTLSKEGPEKAATKTDEELEKEFALSPQFFPRKWMLPKLFTDDIAKDLDIFQRGDDYLIREKDEKGVYEVSLDTHEFKPEEIKINASEDHVLSVEAKHEEKSDDGSRYVSRQLQRKFTIPKECQVNKITSNLSSDGVLVISAPKEGAIEGAGAEKTVPITVQK